MRWLRRLLKVLRVECLWSNTKQASWFFTPGRNMQTLNRGELSVKEITYPCNDCEFVPTWITEGEI
jgi:hypothetical protein